MWHETFYGIAIFTFTYLLKSLTTDRWYFLTQVFDSHIWTLKRFYLKFSEKTISLYMSSILKHDGPNFIGFNKILTESVDD